MKRILLVILLLLPLSAHAEWKQFGSTHSSKGTFSSCGIVYAHAFSNAVSDFYAGYSNAADYPYYWVPNECSAFHESYQGNVLFYIYTNYQPGETLTSPNGEVIYNYVYTDEQCQARGTTTEGLAADATGKIAVKDGCYYEASGVAYQDSEGYWHSNWTPYKSTGEPNTYSSSEDDSAPTDELPDYLTETDDPSSCTSGYMSTGGTTYCVDQSAIDNGNVIGYTPPASSGGGSSGGDDGSSGGNSGDDDSSGDDSGNDGGSSGGGSSGGGSSGGDSGSDTGDDGEDDGWLDELTGFLRGQFDNLVDSLTEDVDTPDDMIAGSSLDSTFEQTEAEQKQVTDRVQEVVDGGEIGQGSSSSIAEQVTSYLPSLPAGSCTPLTIFEGSPYAVTIDCDVFERTRSILGWLLYFFTAYMIIDMFLDTRTTRKA